MAFNLTEAGHQVHPVSCGKEALKAYSEDFDIVITDLRMPGMDGLTLLSRLKNKNPQTVVLVITAYGGTEKALEAMRSGAYYYVEKPINTIAMLALVDNAVKYRRLSSENRQLKSEVKDNSKKTTIVSASTKMSQILRIVDKIADSEATVLLLGESGTGKELIARTIHERSDRSAHPFVTVNCAAIPGELLESILFGHLKGSFSGAIKSSQGKFGLANQGTIFLDEIAELPGPLQSKLLRVLQDGEIDRVGSATPKTVDVRVIAATHQDLSNQVSIGAFRQDLYFRLNVIPIQMPPLRERPEDIPVLLRYFIRAGHPNLTVEVDREVDELLINYNWPGNVRELKNTVERMILLRESDCLTIEDIPLELQTTIPKVVHKQNSHELPFELPEEGLNLAEFEKTLILAVLDKMKGNQSATARYLGIPRHVLLYRMEKFRLR